MSTKPCWPFRNRSSRTAICPRCSMTWPGRLHQVVHFDYLGLALHEATSNTLRIHLLEGTEPTPLPSPPVLPLEEEPAGWVWQTQQAWIFSNVPEEKRWPRALERA